MLFVLNTAKVAAFFNVSFLYLTASHALFHGGELELPLTPLSRSENVHVNSLYAELHSEPISPLTKR